MRLDTRVKFDDVQELVDIGGDDIYGGDATAGWLDLALYDAVGWVVMLGPTWNAADQLDDLHINQATDAAGTGAKAVTGKNIDQTAVNAAGEVFYLECKAADLDTEGGFRFARLECAEAGDSGVDQCRVFAVRHGARYKSEDLNAFTESC